MSPALLALVTAAEAVAFTLDLGSPVLLRRREDALYLAVIARRVELRESAPQVASALGAAAGCPGSIAIAASSLRRRCRE